MKTEGGNLHEHKWQFSGHHYHLICIDYLYIHLEETNMDKSSFDDSPFSPPPALTFCSSGVVLDPCFPLKTAAINGIPGIRAPWSTAISKS